MNEINEQICYRQNEMFSACAEKLFNSRTSRTIPEHLEHPEHSRTILDYPYIQLLFSLIHALLRCIQSSTSSTSISISQYIEALQLKPANFLMRGGMLWKSPTYYILLYYIELLSYLQCVILSFSSVALSFGFYTFVFVPFYLTICFLFHSLSIL